MNLVKLFQQSDVLKLQQCESQQELREFMGKYGINTDAISSLLIQSYQFATIADFNLRQKLKMINLVVNLTEQVIISKTKESFLNSVNKLLKQIGDRDQSCKRTFSQSQIWSIEQYLKDKILEYYELYEIVLDNSPHFKFQAKQSSLIKVIDQNNLQNGSAVEAESIPALKQFLGIRAAKQQKKDPKKK